MKFKKIAKCLILCSFAGNTHFPLSANESLSFEETIVESSANFPTSNEASVDSASVPPALLSPYEQILLERILTAGPSDLDLAVAIGGKDFVTGTGIRNCCTLLHYYSSYFLEDCPEILIEEDLKSMIFNRLYLAVVTDIGEFRQIRLIKNPVENFKNAETLQIYDEMTDTFQPLDADRIREIEINPFSRLVFSERLPLDDETVEHYHAESTPEASITEFFYHEKQKGGQCAVHALNAFFGSRIVSANLLTQFNRAYYGISENGFPTGADTERFFDDYRSDSDIVDSSEGNNPLTIKEFIVDLADKETISSVYRNIRFEMYASLSEEDIRIALSPNAQVDRYVIGFIRPEHFIAFRRNASGEWFRIDSENPIQDRLSPEEFLTSMCGETVFLFYPES